MQPKLSRHDAVGSDRCPSRSGRIPSPVLVQFTTSQSQESLATFILFRFLFSYVVLYVPAYLVTGLPGMEWLQRYQDVWLAPGVWIGRHLLHLNVSLPEHVRGSGDRTCDYLFVLTSMVIAVAVSLVWSMADRKRTACPGLFGGLRFTVRIGLGATLLVHGAAKVFPLQFPVPGLHQLVEPYGNSSPMGLLWMFMGASAGYTIFIGTLEMVAGTLLFLPDCTTLGALLSIGVLSHAFLLNFFYDVPAKLFSSHLLLMGLFLVVPDIAHLMKLLLLKGNVSLRQDEPLFRSPRYNRIFTFSTLAVGMLIASAALANSYEEWQTLRNTATVTPYYGIWAVEQFAANGALRPPVLTDRARWRRLFVETPRLAVIEPIEGPQQFFQLSIDKLHKTLTLIPPDGSTAKLTFDNPRPDRMTLAGTLGGEAISVSLRRIRQPEFALTSHTFHWVSDDPYKQEPTMPSK